MQEKSTKEGESTDRSSDKRKLEGPSTDNKKQSARRRKRHKAALSERSKSCTHACVLPEGVDIPSRSLPEDRYGTLEEPKYTGNPAREFDFPLDPFQKLAVACLERRESVLVGAHTSAGKTVVAEYAAGMAFRDNQRVIYTSPLKALSNQKFREFTEKFEAVGGSDSVGLMTGDVTLNPTANCIVMTTEILRSMLYKGSELLREVAWVVFDEVHYMRDRDRGVVWEETIILLPQEVRMVFLSATLPNAQEFAGWVAQLHSQPCHVVYTEYRPTPLKHYGYPMGGQGLFYLKDQEGNFKTDRFTQMMGQFKMGDGEGGGGSEKVVSRGGVGKPPNPEQMLQIVDMIRTMKFLPCIVFSFSKRQTESDAMLFSKMDFNTEEEKEQIRDTFGKAIAGLSENDQNLPAIKHIQPLLERGIGVHHSGLLPLIKELTEILFQESLVKVLCATETFAMGLNMPAKTVVFTSLYKWDGMTTRRLKCAEYIQMSGRAGRRGLDTEGIVIMMFNENMEAEECKEMMTGEADPLKSSFKLSYYTLLNILRRVEGTQESMDDIIKKSFQQYQHVRREPEMLKRIVELENKANELMPSVSMDNVQKYKNLVAKMDELNAWVNARIMQPQHSLVFMEPGRLIEVKQWGWGVVVGVVTQWGSKQVGEGCLHIADTLLCCSKDENEQPGDIHSPDSEMHVMPVPFEHIVAVGALQISMPDDLRLSEARKDVMNALKRLHYRFTDGMPRLDPQQDMKIADPDFVAKVQELESLTLERIESPIYATLKNQDLVPKFEEKAKLLVEAENLKEGVSKSFYKSFCEEANARMAVLKKLGHVNDAGVVQLKGKVACEIDTADELLCTELLFNGVFNNLDKHSLVAFVSCLLTALDSSNEKIEMEKQLSEPLGKLKETLELIADVSEECKLEICREKYIESAKTSLMDIIYAWSKGATFQQVCEMTDLFEGSVVRSARRLDELMQQMVVAAKVMGDEELAKKFEDSNETIRRDIMFAASLYV